MKRLTKKEVQKRVMETMSGILSSSGIVTPNEAQQGIRAVFEEPPSDKDFLQSVIATMFHRYAEREIKRLVKKGGTEEKLEQVLAQIRANGRGLPAAIRKGLNEMMRKKLPRLGGPGRSHALRPDQEIEACEFIATAIKTKKLTTLPEIFQSVADTFTATGTPVSSQTIKRVWGKRASLYAG